MRAGTRHATQRPRLAHTHTLCTTPGVSAHTRHLSAPLLSLSLFPRKGEVEIKSDERGGLRGGRGRLLEQCPFSSRGVRCGRRGLAGAAPAGPSGRGQRVAAGGWRLRGAGRALAETASRHTTRPTARLARAHAPHITPGVCTRTHALHAYISSLHSYRVTASTAHPVPVAPPPTMRTSKGSVGDDPPRRSEAHMSAREGGFSRSSMRTICECEEREVG